MKSAFLNTAKEGFSADYSMTHAAFGVYSLIIGGPRVEHVGLQFGEEPLLVFALTDLHVQQVRVDGRVVDLHQPLLNGLSWRGDGFHSDNKHVSSVLTHTTFSFTAVHVIIKKPVHRKLFLFFYLLRWHCRDLRT